MKTQNIIANQDYIDLISELKNRVYQAQYNAYKAVDREKVMLYWDIGKRVVEKQSISNWGDSVIHQISQDLQTEFPGVSGFSIRNIRKMRAFYKAYFSSPIRPPLVAKLSWVNNLVIIEKCKDSLERDFYIKLAIRERMSKRHLIKSITQNDYKRIGKSQTNFDSTMSKDRAEAAFAYIKDDYLLDFLNLPEIHSEKDLESALVSNITKFLAELGGMFAFVGRQHRVEIEGREFFIDLLFYHRILKCLIAIELKVGEFQPEYAGKMNFYLSVLDKQSRVEGENPSIGIIICKEKNRTFVEYSLKDINKPLGIGTYSQYTKLEEIPQTISKYLPSKEELERRFFN